MPILLYSLGLWWIYIAVMWLQKRRDSLRKRGLYYPALAFGIVGVLLNVTYNVTVGSILFLDPPREFLFTQRLKRYRRNGGWRGRFATFICERFLNPYDAEHC